MTTVAKNKRLRNKRLPNKEYEYIQKIYKLFSAQDLNHSMNICSDYLFMLSPNANDTENIIIDVNFYKYLENTVFKRIVQIKVFDDLLINTYIQIIYTYRFLLAKNFKKNININIFLKLRESYVNNLFNKYGIIYLYDPINIKMNNIILFNINRLYIVFNDIFPELYDYVETFNIEYSITERIYDALNIKYNMNNLKFIYLLEYVTSYINSDDVYTYTVSSFFTALKHFLNNERQIYIYEYNKNITRRNYIIDLRKCTLNDDERNIMSNIYSIVRY